jgi:sulfonate transport system ATP-binding protein
MSRFLEVQVRAKSFGSVRVLDGIRFALAPGEIVALVGASGCGKSTLLRIVAGLERDFQGAIRIDGATLAGLTREIGFIFQEPRLFPWLTVAANVAFEAGPGAAGDPRVAGLLAEVGLTGYGAALPKQLSGGQSQRVAIARGLYGRPSLLLLDEPFSAVDAFTRMRLQDLIVTVARAHGIALLLVTHDIDEAVYLSDRVLVMQAQPGRIREEIDIDTPRPRNRAAADLAARRAQVFDALHALLAI